MAAGQMCLAIVMAAMALAPSAASFYPAISSDAVGLPKLGTTLVRQKGSGELASDWISAKETPYGDPLTQAPISSWLHVLLATHELSEAASAAKSNLSIDYQLYALGDANSDGASDFVLDREAAPVEWMSASTGEQSPSEHVLTAVSGGVFDTLWTRKISSQSYWYPSGDVTGDGISDLVVVTEKATGSDLALGRYVALVGGGVSSYEQNYIQKNEIISGASGEQVFEKSNPTQYVGKEFDADGYAAGASFRHLEFRRQSIVAIQGLPGFDVLTIHGTSVRSASSSAAYAGINAVYQIVDVERVDGQGDTKWKSNLDFGFGEEPVLLGTGDYDFDGSPDLLFGTRSCATGAFFLVGLSFLCVGLSDREAELVLVDGWTGHVRWRLEATPPVSGSLRIVPVGPLDAEGPDIILQYRGHIEPNLGTYSTRFVAIDGATGNPLFSRIFDRSSAGISDFLDADADGRADLLLTVVPRTTESELGLDAFSLADVLVVTPEFKTLWSFPSDAIGPMTFERNPDLNGDSVEDVFFVRPTQNRDVLAEIRSGANGELLWALPVDLPRTVAFGAVTDVTGDGLVDVYRVAFEVPSQADAELTCGSDGLCSRNFAKYNASLGLFRGSDGAEAWEKTVFVADPAANLSGERPVAVVSDGGDVNQDGLRDLLFDLTSALEVVWEHEGDWVNYKRGDGRAPIDISLIIEGANGATICRYEECALVKRGSSPGVRLGPAAADESLLSGKSSNQSMPAFDNVTLGIGVALILAYVFSKPRRRPKPGEMGFHRRA